MQIKSLHHSRLMDNKSVVCVFVLCRSMFCSVTLNLSYEEPNKCSSQTFRVSSVKRWLALTGPEHICI